MWKSCHMELQALLLLLLLSCLQINAISEEKEKLHEIDHAKIKRQSGNYGFQFQHSTAPIPMSSNYYPVQGSVNGGGRYEYPSSSSNSLYPLRNDRDQYRRGDRDRDYYPSTYAGRSGTGIIGGGGVGSGSSSYPNYIGRDDYRGGDYRDRAPLSPYPYDDYRYNNNYQREREEAQNLEHIMRNGQQRHADYQKRMGQSGQEYYDPFYFIGIKNKNMNGEGGLSAPLSLSQSPSFPPPPASSPNGPHPSEVAVVPSNPNPTGQGQSVASSPSAPASHPLRNRRNSRLRPNDYYSNDINGDNYELMNPNKGSYAHHHHRNHHLDQQFLTREQLVRQHPDARVAYNNVDGFGPVSGGGSGLPWSVRIGTQLKVNDDGRSPNPHRFYVRDEINRERPRSRYPGPIYRRK